MTRSPLLAALSVVLLCGVLSKVSASPSLCRKFVAIVPGGSNDTVVDDVRGTWDFTRFGMGSNSLPGYSKFRSWARVGIRRGSDSSRGRWEFRSNTGSSELYAYKECSEPTCVEVPTNSWTVTRESGLSSVMVTCLEWHNPLENKICPGYLNVQMADDVPFRLPEVVGKYVFSGVNYGELKYEHTNGTARFAQWRGHCCSTDSNPRGISTPHWGINVKGRRVATAGARSFDDWHELPKRFRVRERQFNIYLSVECVEAGDTELARGL